MRDALGYFIRKKCALCDKRPAQSNSVLLIQIEYRDGCPTARSHAHHHRPLPAKMIGPSVGAWMKQQNRTVGDRINASQVRPLLTVAFRATPRQILHRIIMPMLRGDDVIDIESSHIARLRKFAILAPITGTGNNQLLCRQVDHVKPPMSEASRPIEPWISRGKEDRRRQYSRRILPPPRR